jgi:hypothetical protein
MPKPPSEHPHATSGDEAPAPRPATLAQIISAVFWSFFGVRRGDAMRRDLVAIRPHQVIIVGILIAVALVVALLIIVRVITRSV